MNLIAERGSPCPHEPPSTLSADAAVRAPVLPFNFHSPMKLCFSLGLALWPCLGQAEAEFRAGAATVNITPPLGIEINGGTAPVIATHVHDELHARALVLEDRSTRLAFVVADNCLIDRALFDEAKAFIFQHTGIPSNHVALSTTHTHSAGSAT